MRSLDVERECSACDERHGRPRLPIRRLHVAVTHTTVGAAAVTDGPHPPAPEVELPPEVRGAARAATDGSPAPCWFDELDLGSGVAGAVAVRTDEEVTLRVADAASLLD